MVRVRGGPKTRPETTKSRFQRTVDRGSPVDGVGLRVGLPGALRHKLEAWAIWHAGWSGARWLWAGLRGRLVEAGGARAGVPQSAVSRISGPDLGLTHLALLGTS